MACAFQYALALFVIFAVGSALTHPKHPAAKHAKHAKHVAPHVPRRSWAKDCFQKKSINMLQFQQELVGEGIPTPGAGTEPDQMTPFGTVFKDGYMHTRCVKDAMFYSGDKFGDNKFDYNEKHLSNTSIVHYKAFVKKEDRADMTIELCFDFCRTMDQMQFFGLVNGRDCYCTPYFKPVPGDSSMCDATCDGDKSRTCGGKTKSDIFAMHQCNDGLVVFARAALKAFQAKSKLDSVANPAFDKAESQQTDAAKLQKTFGQAGDPAASELMQAAKTDAGVLLHAAEEGKAVSISLGASLSDVSDLADLSFPIAGIKGIAKALEAFLQRPTEVTRAKKLKEIDELLLSSMKGGKGGNIDFSDFEVAEAVEVLEEKLEAQTTMAVAAYKNIQKYYLTMSPQSSSDFEVVSGPCKVAGSCVTSMNYGVGDYLSDEACEIKVKGGKAQLKFEKFDTEAGFDHLHINGNCYSGPSCDGKLRMKGGDCSCGDAETSVTMESMNVATDKITWESDGCAQGSGWKFCAEEPAPKCGDKAEYYPAMYFVDKKFVGVPSTCIGVPIGDPMHVDYDTCACQCDSHISNCVGFSHFPSTGGGLCFLFSEFKSIQYYTGCSDCTKPANEGGSGPTCAAKLSAFEGGTLKPDPSGKCDRCFTKATKADRCY